MNNYPAGCPEPLDTEEVNYYCKDCGHEWQVQFVKDMGTWEPTGDTRCPVCRKEGERELA